MLALTAGTTLAQGERPEPAGESPAALAREYAAARQKMRLLDDRIDGLRARIRTRERAVRRELENSPEIEQARLGVRDARHDYYQARDRVVASLKGDEQYVQAKRRVEELNEQIAALRPRREAELARAAGEEKAAPASATVRGDGEAPAGADGQGPAAPATPPADNDADDQASVQDRIFELATQKLRAADHAASIEAEALRGDPEVLKAWDAYATASDRLKALQADVDRQLRQHEELAELRDELADLEDEYETLEITARSARVAYETELAERERQRRHERELEEDDDFDPWNPLDRVERQWRRRLWRGR